MKYFLSTQPLTHEKTLIHWTARCEISVDKTTNLSTKGEKMENSRTLHEDFYTRLEDTINDSNKSYLELEKITGIPDSTLIHM